MVNTNAYSPHDFHVSLRSARKNAPQHKSVVSDHRAYSRCSRAQAIWYGEQANASTPSQQTPCQANAPVFTNNSRQTQYMAAIASKLMHAGNVLAAASLLPNSRAHQRARR